MKRLIMRSQARRQGGAVLLIALIFLIILTLLGLSAIDGTVLETKMAHNTREKNWALQVAEMGLLQGDSIVREFSTDATVLNVLMDEGSYSAGMDLQDIERDGSVKAETKGTELLYLGRFPLNAPTSGGQAYSVLQTEAVYFVTQSTGAADAELNTEITLRNGIRQRVPKPN